jgi:DMSO/TMAO reductase YedYZ heme-binding membrane subunit
MPAVIHVTPNIWWYFARAGGLVAWGLLAATVFWGLIYAGRLTRKMPTPGWNLDLHRFLGCLAVIFVAIHVTALMADRYVNFGVEQVLIPFASHWRPGAIAWGITAMYLVLAVEVTSLAMRWLPRKLWRQIHMLSFVLFVTSTVHAIQSGTDTGQPWVRGIGIVLLATATVTLVLRVLEGRRKAAARAGRLPAVVTPNLPVAAAPPASAAPEFAPAGGVLEPMDWSSVGPLPSIGDIAAPAAPLRSAAPRPPGPRAGVVRPRPIDDVPVRPAARPVASGVGSSDGRRPGGTTNCRGHLTPRRPYEMATPRRDAAPWTAGQERPAVAGAPTGPPDATRSPGQGESPLAGAAVSGPAVLPPRRPPKVHRFAEPPAAGAPTAPVRESRVEAEIPDSTFRS